MRNQFNLPKCFKSFSCQWFCQSLKILSKVVPSQFANVSQKCWKQHKNNIPSEKGGLTLHFRPTTKTLSSQTVNSIWCISIIFCFHWSSEFWWLSNFTCRGRVFQMFWKLKSKIKVKPWEAWMMKHGLESVRTSLRIRFVEICTFGKKKKNMLQNDEKHSTVENWGFHPGFRKYIKLKLN